MIRILLFLLLLTVILPAYASKSMGADELIYSSNNASLMKHDQAKNPVADNKVIGMISGKVKSSHGSIVINEPISLFVNQKLISKTWTHEAGTFRFVNLPAGKYSVSCGGGKTYVGTSKSVTIDSLHKFITVDIVLQPIDALPEALLSNHNDFPQVIVDGQGHYQAKKTEIPQLYNDPKLFATLKGKVIDDNGFPVGYCNVRLSNEYKISKHTFTDSKGFYKIDQIPPGVYQVNFQPLRELSLSTHRKIIHSRKNETLNATLTRRTNIEITLDPVGYIYPIGNRLTAQNDTTLQYGTLKGKVLNRKGTGLKPCIVKLSFPYRSPISAKVSPDGTYQLDGIPSGEYRLRANYSGVIPSKHEKILIKPNKATVLRLKVKNLHRFGGIIIPPMQRKSDQKTGSGQDINLENYEYYK